MNKKKITNLIFNISFFLFKKNVKSNFLHNFQMVDGFRQKKIKKKKIWLKNWKVSWDFLLIFKNLSNFRIKISMYYSLWSMVLHLNHNTTNTKVNLNWNLERNSKCVFLLTLTPSPAELLTNSFSESNPVPS
jgi:hypothetical protein